MRLIKFLLVVMVALVSHRGLAQSQPDESANATAFSTEKDPTKSVHIYPNPATEFVYVKVEEIPASKIKVSLTNIIGNNVEAESEIMNEHEIRIKVKDLASGYYLLTVKEEGNNRFRSTFKVLKR
jgi:hypothetical protein